jgi:hypothetical protein
MNSSKKLKRHPMWIHAEKTVIELKIELFSN